MIASSALGQCALQIPYESACFPPPPTTSVSVITTTAPVAVPFEPETLPPDSFSVDEPVDVSTPQSVGDHSNFTVVVS